MKKNIEISGDEKLEQRALSLEQLKEQLKKANIDIGQWGKGTAKTVEHLLKEIKEGETALTTSKRGELLREVMVATADIYYTSPEGRRFKLEEKEQIFNNGRKRKRKLAPSISEKIKVDERPNRAITRGIKEELDVTGEIKLQAIRVDEETIESPSYPGLLSHYVLHRFEAELSKEQVDPKGYTEKRDKLTTYFVWKPTEE